MKAKIWLPAILAAVAVGAYFYGCSTQKDSGANSECLIANEVLTQPTIY